MNRSSSISHVPEALSQALLAVRREGAVEDRDLGAFVSSLSNLERHRLLLGLIS